MDDHDHTEDAFDDSAYEDNYDALNDDLRDGGILVALGESSHDRNPHTFASKKISEMTPLLTKEKYLDEVATLETIQTTARMFTGFGFAKLWGVDDVSEGQLMCNVNTFVVLMASFILSGMRVVM